MVARDPGRDRGRNPVCLAGGDLAVGPELGICPLGCGSLGERRAARSSAGGGGAHWCRPDPLVNSVAANPQTLVDGPGNLAWNSLGSTVPGPAVDGVCDQPSMARDSAGCVGFSAVRRRGAPQCPVVDTTAGLEALGSSFPGLHGLVVAAGGLGGGLVGSRACAGEGGGIF